MKKVLSLSVLMLFVLVGTAVAQDVDTKELPPPVVTIEDTAFRVAWGVEFGEGDWEPSYQTILWRDALDHEDDLAEAHLFGELGVFARPQSGEFGFGGYFTVHGSISDQFHAFAELGLETTVYPVAKVRGVFHVGFGWEF